MSLSSELREWVVAAKELWQEEQRKHPYRHWIIAGIVFVYFTAHYFLEQQH